MAAPARSIDFEEWLANKMHAASMQSEKAMDASDDSTKSPVLWDNMRKRPRPSMFKFPEASGDFVKNAPRYGLTLLKEQESYLKFWKQACYDELLMWLESHGFDISNPDKVQELILNLMEGR